MKKGMKKMRMVAECNNKAEMISRAIGFLEMQGEIIASDWAGNWDGMQWSERFVFINPEFAGKHNELIFKEFGVKISKL